jgi:hypothetical protein
VRGLDADGKAFYQNANLQPIAYDRAAIEGLLSQVGTGEVIGVQIGDAKVRVRLMHKEAQPDGPPLVHVRLVAGQVSPWADMLGSNATPDAAPRPIDRRALRRVKVSVPVELQRASADPSVTAITADISMGGCYVEMLNPLPAATHLLLTLWLGDYKLATRGIVRTSHAGIGIGVEFLDPSDEVKLRLRAFLDEVSPVRRPAARI